MQYLLKSCPDLAGALSKLEEVELEVEVEGSQAASHGLQSFPLFLEESWEQPKPHCLEARESLGSKAPSPLGAAGAPPT